MKNVVIILTLVLSICASPVAARDGDASDDEIAHLCNIAYGMCYAACKRNQNTVSGVVLQGYCEADCDRSYEQCIGSYGGTVGPARTDGGRRGRSLQNFSNQTIFSTD